MLDFVEKYQTVLSDGDDNRDWGDADSGDEPDTNGEGDDDNKDEE